MLTHLPSYLQKIYDRGVDIGVGIATGVALAIIGLLFWRGKLWLELRADARKQWQQWEIAGKHEHLMAMKKAEERNERLAKERANYAKAVRAAQHHEELVHLWDQYVQWIHDNGLQYLPHNATTFSKNSFNSGIRKRCLSGVPDFVERDRAEMEEIINETQLQAAN